MHTINSSAGLDIIIGPMFSGKTSELLRRLFTTAEVGKRTLYINNKIDNRNENDVFSTHNPQIKDKLSSYKVDMMNTDDLSKIDDLKIDTYDIVGIDECQFFKDVSPITKWIKKLNKRIIIASLDGDYKTNMFGNVLSLIPKCTSIVKLHAYCMQCASNKKLEPAYFTNKKTVLCNLSDSDKTTSNVIEIGEHDKYEALCLQCYNENNNFYHTTDDKTQD
jgi:thymidine kinase